jgi:hypothetical protein
MNTKANELYRIAKGKSSREKNTFHFLNDDWNFMVLMNDMLQNLKQSIYAVTHQIKLISLYSCFMHIVSPSDLLLL